MNVSKPATETGAYWAFLSYSHRDERFASKLHRALETYNGHERLVGSINRYGEPVPARLFPIFRDRDELEGAASLPERIHETLRRSRFLIVVCSPNAVASNWVNDEIKAFKALGGEDRVLAIIADGEPNAGDHFQSRPRECFPEALRYRMGPDGRLTSEPTQPIAGDARPGKDGDRNARLRILAAILGVRFDDLKQRDLERQRQFWMRVGCGALAGFAILLALTIYAFIQRNEAVRQSDLAEQRARIALSRQLLTQAGLDRNRQGGGLERGALLALESLRLHPSGEASSLVHGALRLLMRPVGRFSHPGQSSHGLAFTDDGQRIVTINNDRTTSILDVESGGRQEGPPHGGDNHLGGIATMTADGRLLATVIKGVGMQAIDTLSGRVLVNYEDPADDIGKRSRLVFSQNGTRLAWGLRHDRPRGRWAYTIRVWHLGTGQVVDEVRGATFLDQVALSADATRLLAATSEDEKLTIEAWTLAGPAALARWELERSGVCAFAPDGQRALTSGEESYAILDLTTGRVVKEVKTSQKPQQCVFSSDGAFVAIVVNTSVTVCDAETGYVRGEFVQHESVHSVVFSPDGRRVATGASDGTARVWDIETRQEIARVFHPSDDTGRLWVDRLAFSPDGRRLASSGWDGMVRVVELGGGAELTRVAVGRPAERNPFGMGPDGVIVATTSGNTVTLTDLPSGRSVARFEHKDAGESEVAAVIGKDNEWLVTVASGYMMHFSGRRPTARLWRIPDGREQGQRTELAMVAGALAVSPDGSYAAASARDKTDITIWMPGRGEPPIQLSNTETITSLAIGGSTPLLAASGASLRVWAMTATPSLPKRVALGTTGPVALSRDGRWLAAGVADNTVRLYEVDTLTERANYYHDASISAVAFSLDGQRLGTGTTRGNVDIWELDIGREVARIPHGSVLEALAFDIDGRHIATVTQAVLPGKFEAHLWRWRVDDLATAVCERVGRNLSKAEWLEHVGVETPFRKICQ